MRKERAARLRAAGERALARYLERQVGRTAQVLVERDGRGPHRGVRAVPDRDGRRRAAARRVVTARAERIEDGVVIGRLAA